MPQLNSVSTLQKLRVRIRNGLFLLLAITLAGMIGYRILEEVSWLTALYYSICVLTTLGLPDLPTNSATQAFTIILAMGGIGLFLYALGALAQFVVAGEFQRALGRRKVLRQMRKQHDHYIICGYGRMGQRVVHEMIKHSHDFVVVERDLAMLQELEEAGLVALRGDASHEEVLEQCGLERARGLIITTNSDAENILITMTARQISPTIPIIVRCDVEANTAKFIRAGATRVITPYNTSAAQIALAATKPHVIDLLDLATGTSQQEFEIREILVPENSPAVGQSLMQLALGARFEVIVIGIKSQEQPMKFNPSAATVIPAGGTLITVGRDEKFQQLEAFLTRGTRA